MGSLTSTGAAGTWVSTVTENGEDATLVTPETVSAAVTLGLPSASFVDVTVHAPVPSAVAVPSSVVPSNTFTVLFATAVPFRVSVLALVMPSPTTPLSGENEVIFGAAGTGGGGGDAGITGSSAWDTALAVPATSVAFAVRTWVPLDRALVVMLQFPVEL